MEFFKSGTGASYDELRIGNEKAPAFLEEHMNLMQQWGDANLSVAWYETKEAKHGRYLLVFMCHGDYIGTYYKEMPSLLKSLKEKLEILALHFQITAAVQSA